MESRQIFDKLINIYFKKCYYGFGVPSEEDESFIKENTIIVKPHLNGGYKLDIQHIQEKLDLEKEYTLLDMSVSQSSSTLRLKEFPYTSFNTVNFTYRLDE